MAVSSAELHLMFAHRLVQIFVDIRNDLIHLVIELCATIACNLARYPRKPELPKLLRDPKHLLVIEVLIATAVDSLHKPLLA